VEGFAEHKKATLSSGSSLHTNICSYLDGKSVDVLPANEGHWKSMGSVLDDVDGVKCQEQSVRHAALQYKGVLDCVANFRGVKSVIEWKTSKRCRSDIRQTYDNPLQLAAYLGAYNSDSSNEQIEQCVLVIAHEDGSCADIHLINKVDCVRYWKQWLRRVHAYWLQYTTKSQQQQQYFS